MLARLFIALQYLLPKHVVTRLIWRIARIRNTRIKNLLITRFVSAFDVNTKEVALAVPDDFASFNDFFIRELADGERTIAADAETIIAPVDGTVSAAGRILDGDVFQAKGIDYSLQDLLATDIDEANAFLNGNFATIYLAPYNYHRVHAPIEGELLAAHFVPGDLFSVNQATVARVDGLFRRNERLVMHFKTPVGPAVLVFVGALNVGSISTPWSGEIRPRKRGVVEAIALPEPRPQVQKGDLLGWFNMGSTVILLLPGEITQWQDELKPGRTLRMGEAIAAVRAGKP